MDKANQQPDIRQAKRTSAGGGGMAPTKLKTGSESQKTKSSSVSQYAADTVITSALKAKFLADGNILFNKGFFCFL